MKTRPGILAVTTVLLAGLVWLCWPAGPLSPAEPPRSPAGDAANSSIVRADGDTDAASTAPAPPRQDATAWPPASPPPEPTGGRLHIVDADGKSLPGAEYFEAAMPYGSDRGLLESQAWRARWEPEAWLAEHGTRTIADAAGMVSARTTDVPWLYVARHDGRLAFWGFPFPDELQVLPEQTCVVCVVDTAGRRVHDAAVVLRDDDSPGTSRSPIVGITDANGECRVRHLQRLQDERSRDEVHRLGVRGLGLRSGDVTIDPLRLPDRVTITVPPCAMLAVELVDPVARPYTAPQGVLLISDKGEELLEYTREHGPIDFGHCAVGAELRVDTAGGYRLNGPPTPNRRHVARVPIHALVPGGMVFTGIARRSDGTPLGNVDLAAEASGGLGPLYTTTGADGRFAFLLDRAEASRVVDHARLVQRERNRDDEWIERRGLEVPLAPLLQPGVHDLGDLRLDDAVLALRGRVRGPEGPLADARVAVNHWSRGVDLRCGADGAFEVWALRLRREVSLDFSATAHGGRSFTTLIPGPDLDVVLAADGPGTIEVAVDPAVVTNHDSMYAELIGARGVRLRNDGEPGDGVVRYDFRVAPGAYRCEVRSPFQPAPLATIERLVVVAAPGDAPPTTIDLRGRLHAGRVQWADEDGGERILGLAVAFAPAVQRTVGGRPEVEAVDVHASYGMSLVASTPLRVVVESDDGVGVFEGLPKDGSLVLRARTAVTVRVPALPVPQPGASWRIVATAESGDAAVLLRAPGWTQPRSVVRAVGAIDESTSTRLLLLANSRYRIQLERVVAGRPNEPLTEALGTVPLDVPSPLPAELTVMFPPEVLRKAAR